MKIKLIGGIKIPIPIENVDWERIILFSDTHMGGGKDDDDFDAEKFNWLINDYTSIDDLLIGVGDILDQWESGERMFQHYTTLLRTMYFERDFILVPGNHDLRMSKLSEVFSTSKQITIAGMHIEHGNEADMFNSKFHFIGEAVTKVHAFFQRVLGKRVDKLEKRFAKLNLKMKRPSKLDEQEFAKVEQQYIDHMTAQVNANPNAFVGVFGHTHRAGFWEVGKTQMQGKEYPLILINCGTFTSDSTFVVVDRKGFSLCRVEE